MASKSIEQKFRKLSEVEHCLARPGRYIGSIKPHTADEYVPSVKSATDVTMVKGSYTYNPGFLKLFDEVISNSADHSKRPEGKHLDTIRVEVDQDKGEITVYDNGGIPVVKHKEYDQWVPEMIFELRAGTNFDDSEEQTLTGQNGEGAALTCIFSTKFRVETCDGKNRFLMTFTDNSQGRPPAKVTPANGDKGYTKITYQPDFEKLGMSGIDGDNMNMLLARVYEIAATNTHLKVYFNGTRVMTRTFKDYIEMFVGKDGEYVFDDGESFKVGVAKSDDGFTHTSFVNTTRTKIGGTHITYVVNQIVDSVREFIKKRHRVDVKPSDVRNHLHLFIDATIVNPRYSSQTKDELITEPSAYGRTWSVPEKFIAKLVKSDIIKAILDWVAAKEQAQILADLRKVNKDTDRINFRRIDKFADAQERHQRHKCILFLAEGDCMLDTTEVRVLREGGYEDVQVKDIRPGDMVLTHTNSLKEVKHVAFSVKPSITIKYSGRDLVVSPDHRLAAYDPSTNTFEWVAAKNLTTAHKLIRSTVVDAIHAPVTEVLEVDGGFSITMDLLGVPETWDSTPSHLFYALDLDTLTYSMVKAMDLREGRHAITFRP